MRVRVGVRGEALSRLSSSIISSLALTLALTPNLTLSYPIVTNIAFEAFACVKFDDGSSYLAVDVSMQCGSAAHHEAMQIAWIAVIIYVGGLWVLNALLILRARPAILTSQPTTLSNSIAFLHMEYVSHLIYPKHPQKLHRVTDLLHAPVNLLKVLAACILVGADGGVLPALDTKTSVPADRRAVQLPTQNSVHLDLPPQMARRFLLVGLFVVVPYRRGSMMQLALATIVCWVYLIVQLVAMPYRTLSDNYLALACSTCLAMLFLGCMLFKFAALIEMPGVRHRRTACTNLTACHHMCFCVVQHSLRPT